jgi:pilus assembly protein CpaF
MGADGVRRVNEIVAVPGRVEHDVIETEPLFVRDAGRLVRTQGMPSRMEAFERARIDVLQVLQGAG